MAKFLVLKSLWSLTEGKGYEPGQTVEFQPLETKEDPDGSIIMTGTDTKYLISLGVIEPIMDEPDKQGKRRTRAEDLNNG